MSYFATILLNTPKTMKQEP